jgi:hypothetical protein
VFFWGDVGNFLLKTYSSKVITRMKIIEVSYMLSCNIFSIIVTFVVLLEVHNSSKK